MSREWVMFFEDMIESCSRILEYTTGLDRSEFESKKLVFDATVHNVEIIGEAARNIPKSP